MKKQFLVMAAVSALTISVVSCGDSTKETKESTMDSSGTAMMEDTSAKMTMEEKGVMVGGAMMVPSKNIVENAVNSADHTTLVAAVKQAGLVETLSGAGPFTVFAPTNTAFDAVPKATLESLMKPEMKDKLTNILTYHVVRGMLKAADLKDVQ